MTTARREMEACPRCGFCNDSTPVYSQELGSPEWRVECLACGFEGNQALSIKEAARLWNEMERAA